MILTDKAIRERLARVDSDRDRLRIDPFVDYGQCPAGVVSYGLTSAGYDVRLGDQFKVFTDVRGATVSPRSIPEDAFVSMHGPVCRIPPNSFALAKTVETFRIPRDVVANCLGKSTYTRCGIIITVTPLEPEWEGRITVEISNTTPCPAELFAGEGVMQIQFHLLTSICERSYADKKGVYQGQDDITFPRIRR